MTTKPILAAAMFAIASLAISRADVIFNNLPANLATDLPAPVNSGGYGWDAQAFTSDSSNLLLTSVTAELGAAPFPAALTKWKYRAIYRVADGQVGVWSAVKEITVGG